MRNQPRMLILRAARRVVLYATFARLPCCQLRCDIAARRRMKLLLVAFLIEL